ncbi:helix-turn-helix domain-containing protein [Flavobacteriaceae bacterium]|nr:helix-turn-helix domain-containing protein [Flavobacteriaceae bacterium]
MKALETILTTHIESKPEYLIELFKQLYKHSAIEYKDKLTSKEAAYYLGISVRTLDNICCNRQISYYKYGKHREFTLADLKQYRKKKETYYSAIM